METYPLKDPEMLERHAGLEKALSSDYRLSFKFSQGSAKLQEILFVLLGVEYSRQYGQKHVSAASALNDWAILSIPPANHKRVDAEHIDRESVAESEKFRHYIDHPDLSCLIDDPEIYRDLMAGAIALTLSRDIKYVDKHFQYMGDDRTMNNNALEPHLKLNGRPGRPDPIRYVSFFKKYVVDERPTGSDAFNAIFQDMRTQSLLYPSPRIERLALAWELRHQGKSFYTPDFMPDFESSNPVG
jgi:hypothetical protein